LVVPSFLFPYVFPKVILFRSLVATLVASFALLWIVEGRQLRPRPSGLVIALLALVASLVASTVCGVDPRLSLWDTWERMLGLFSWLHYAAFFLILATVFRSAQDWLVLIRWGALVGALVGVIAILQRADSQFLLNRGATRVVSTLGHPAYLAGFGLFSVWCGLLLLQDRNLLSRLLASASFSLGLAAVVCSETRGTLLALVAAAMLVGTCYLWKRPIGRWVLGGCAVVFVATIAVAMLFPSLFESVPGLRRLADLDTGKTRLLAWGTAGRAALARPLLGYGPNNYAHAFSSHFDLEFHRFPWREQWFDDAHNVLLNTLVEQGVLGVLALLALYAAAFRHLWRLRHQGVPRIWRVATAAFLVGHLTHSLFIFEDASSLLSLCFVLAFLQAQPLQKNKEGAFKQHLRLWQIVAVNLALGMFLVWFSALPACANRAGFRARETAHAGLQEAPDQLQAALAYRSPHRSDLRFLYAGAVLDSLSRRAAELSHEIVSSHLESAFRGLTVNTEEHPLNVRVELLRGELAVQYSSLVGDPSLLDTAREGLLRALSTAPHRQDLSVTLAAVELELGRNEDAVARLSACIEKAPFHAEVYWRLAWIYWAMGSKEQARALLSTAKQRGCRFEGRGRQVVRMIRKDDD
jgi:O-antigen ligase